MFSTMFYWNLVFQIFVVLLLFCYCHNHMEFRRNRPSAETVINCQTNEFCNCTALDRYRFTKQISWLLNYLHPFNGNKNSQELRAQSKQKLLLILWCDPTVRCDWCSNRSVLTKTPKSMSLYHLSKIIKQVNDANNNQQHERIQRSPKLSTPLKRREDNLQKLDILCEYYVTECKPLRKHKSSQKQKKPIKLEHSEMLTKLMLQYHQTRSKHHLNNTKINQSETVQNKTNSLPKSLLQQQEMKKSNRTLHKSRSNPIPTTNNFNLKPAKEMKPNESYMTVNRFEMFPKFLLQQQEMKKSNRTSHNSGSNQIPTINNIFNLQPVKEIKLNESYMTVNRLEMFPKFLLQQQQQMHLNRNNRLLSTLIKNKLKKQIENKQNYTNFNSTELKPNTQTNNSNFLDDIQYLNEVLGEIIKRHSRSIQDFNLLTSNGNKTAKNTKNDNLFSNDKQTIGHVYSPNGTRIEFNYENPIDFYRYANELPRQTSETVSSTNTAVNQFTDNITSDNLQNNDTQSKSTGFNFQNPIDFFQYINTLTNQTLQTAIPQVVNESIENSTNNLGHAELSNSTTIEVTFEKPVDLFTYKSKAINEKLSTTMPSTSPMVNQFINNSTSDNLQNQKQIEFNYSDPVSYMNNSRRKNLLNSMEINQFNDPDQSKISQNSTNSSIVKNLLNYNLNDGKRKHLDGLLPTENVNITFANKLFDMNKNSTTTEQTNLNNFVDIKKVTPEQFLTNNETVTDLISESSSTEDTKIVDKPTHKWFELHDYIKMMRDRINFNNTEETTTLKYEKNYSIKTLEQSLLEVINQFRRTLNDSKHNSILNALTKIVDFEIRNLKADHPNYKLTMRELTDGVDKMDAMVRYLILNQPYNDTAEQFPFVNELKRQKRALYVIFDSLFLKIFKAADKMVLNIVNDDDDNHIPIYRELTVYECEPGCNCSSTDNVTTVTHDMLHRKLQQIEDEVNNRRIFYEKPRHKLPIRLE